MKILRIELHNLASLEGPYTIDFTQTPLLNAGVFAITGPTGAGKSTILDAICLALYGNAPRYSNGHEGGTKMQELNGSDITSNDARHILRRGAGQGYAKLDFVGVDGITYRASWTVRRANNRPNGKLQQKQNTLQSLQDPDYFITIFSQFKTAVEEKTGLNYEQFTRSVLLAQGEFTAFLKASPADKASLLEKLSGTSIYSEISKKIHERKRIEEAALTQLKQQLGGVQLLSEEEKNELEQQITTLNREIDTTVIQLNQCLAAMRWLRELQQKAGELEEAEALLAQAQINKLNFQESSELLEKVNHAQKALSHLKAYQERTQQVELRLHQHQQLEQQLHTFTAEKTGLQHALVTEQQLLQQLLQSQEAKQPSFHRGRVLEQQLLEMEQGLLELTNRGTATQEQLAQALQRKENQQEEHQRLLHHQQSIIAWQEEYAAYKRLAEQEALLLNFTQRTHQLQQEQAALQVSLSEKKEALQAQRSSIATLNQSQTELQKLLQELRNTYTAQQELVARYDASSLRTQRDQLQSAIDAIKDLRQHQQATAAAAAALHQTQLQLTTWQQEQATLLSEKKEVEINLQRQSSELEGARKMLDQARLVVAETVEQLRQQLQPGEACAVCGSKEHPFTEHQPFSNQVLQQLDSKYTALSNEIRATQTQHGALSQQLITLEKNQQLGQEQLQLQQVQFEQLRSNRPRTEWATLLEQIEPNHQENWLTQQLQELHQQQQLLAEQQIAYDQQVATLQSLSSSLQHHTQEQQRVQEALTQSTPLYAQLESTVSHLQDQLMQSANALQALKRELGEYLTLPNWEELLVHVPLQLAAEISSKAAEWTLKEQQLRALAAQLTECQGQVALRTQEWEAAKTVLEGLQREFKEQKELQRLKKSELQTILEDFPTIQAAESALRTLVEQRQHQVEHLHQQVRQLELTIQGLLAQQASLIQENQRDQELADKEKQNINQALQASANHLTWEDLIYLSTLTDEWIQQTRETNQQINTDLLQRAAIVKERKLQLEQHETGRPTQLSHTALEASAHQLEADRKEKTELLHTLHIQRQRDRALQEQFQQMQVQISNQERNFDRWNRLNALIGSHDGAAFRKIAQQYTLENLLAFASIHLKHLNPRYELQRLPNQVAIQIVDKDMGDEVRSVNTLSGGESFLVSLALALGLASLSAENVVVESLFIDEGFGSLDPKTLTIAMDALERLQSMGRKVGVISHVQEMTERIPVQIKIQKQRGGSSILEVG